MSRTLPVMRRPSRGFTLIELLIVLLIVLILMAVAVPMYLSATADAQFKVCRQNMESIANSVQAAKVKDIAPDYSTWIGQRVADLISAGKLQDLNVSPTCPNGSYFQIDQGSTLDNTTFLVRCCPLHGTYEPGVSSN